MGENIVYWLLECKIHSCRLNKRQVAEVLRISPLTLANRLAGKQPWLLREVYALCDLLTIPYTDIPVYFPEKEVLNDED